MGRWYGVRQLKSGRFQGRALVDGKRVSVGTFADGWSAHDAVLRTKRDYRPGSFTAGEIVNIANAALDYYVAAARGQRR